MKYTCQQCGRIFVDRKRPDRIVKFCSQFCYGDSKKSKPAWNKGKPAPWALNNTFAKGNKPWNKGIKGLWSGNKNPRWKEGKWLTVQGYIHLLHPFHPRTSKRGYVPEQVLVAEKYLGRFLVKDEVIHHINAIKTDNRPENLYVFPNKKEHARHHQNMLLGKEKPKVSNLI